MIREKTNKKQLWITLMVMFLFLAGFIFSGFPVQARAPVVVIQPGHSLGYDSGAVNTSTGVREAEVNAAVAAKVATKLQQQGYTVYLTHPVANCSVQSLLTNAEANSLSNVAKAVNKINPDLEISIHHNSGGSSASGYEFYWSSYRDFDQEGVHEVSGLWPGDMAYQDISPCTAAQQSKALTTILESNFSGIGINFRKTVERDDYVQAHVTCPSVLIEGGFISNDSESLLLASDAYQEKMSGRIVNSVNQYFGSTEIDLTAPTAESITNNGSPTSDAIFTAYANGVKDDGSGVREVLFAVWSEANGQDDIKWYSGIDVGNGQWKADIDIREHNDELGKYIIHVYANDFAGNQQGLGATSVDVVQVSSVSNGVNISEISLSGFIVTAKNLGDYTDLQFPVWSENGGQDDIVWYKGIRQTDGSYRVNIDTKNHNNDVGKYNVHVYGTDKNGKMVGLWTTSTNVPQMTAGDVNISEVKDGKFTVTVSGIEAPAGISSIKIPVWSENNGQDDILWYDAKRRNDNTYTLDVDIAKHGYDVGKYNIHVYGTDKNGKMVGLWTTSTNVPQMTAGDVNISEVKDGKFTVTVSGIEAPAGISSIKIPVWSENNGQDDILWYDAKRRNDNTYTLDVDIAKHGYDVGKYNIHVYGTDKNGKMVGLWTTSTNVPQMTAGDVNISEVKDGKFTVTVSGIEAPAGISSIKIPVWSENNGQDDILWYDAKRRNDNTYTLDVDIAKHGYDVGKYNVHVYGTDKNGKMVGLWTTSTNVPQMTAGDVNISEVKDGKFTVTVSGIEAPAGISSIKIPVWSENNGQDDLVWYIAQKQSDGSYQATIQLKDHGYNTGDYNIHYYGIDNNGKQQFLGYTTISITTDDVPDIITNFTSDTTIMGKTTKQAQDLAAYFTSKASFPSDFYGMSATDFAALYIEECKMEGVRPEVAFAQMCLETGYLQYNGDVKREQYNFAGIGATGNGAQGNSFSDVRIGIRAQVQHLKAYASTDSLVNECVDPRYQWVVKGCAPTIGDLAGKWASDKNYGIKLVTIMNAF